MMETSETIFRFAELFVENRYCRFVNLQLRNFEHQFCRTNVSLYKILEIFAISVVSS
jgi:hypothetical protein